MSDTIFLEKCQAYIDCHLKPGQGAAGQQLLATPSVTVSRQTGAGGLRVAEALAEWLEAHTPRSSCPWIVFHKNLVNKVLEDNKLPTRLAQFMPEDKVSAISDAVEEILGLHPPSWKLVRQTTETILQLAELGRAIVVGRGATVITQGLSNVFHVRLVGSLQKRVARIMEAHKIGSVAARAFIKKTDSGRKRYVKRYYGDDVENPLLYHLTLNTDFLSVDDCVAMIGQGMLRKYYPDLQKG